MVHFLVPQQGLWLSVNTATSPHLLRLIFYRAQLRGPHLRSALRKLPRCTAVPPSLGPAGPTRPCPTGPLHARPSCVVKVPQGPLMGQASNPGCYSQASRQPPVAPTGPTSSPLPVATQGHHTPSHSCTLQRVPRLHFWSARPHSCPPWPGVIMCLIFQFSTLARPRAQPVPR